MDNSNFTDFLATVLTGPDFDRALAGIRPARDSSVPDWLYEYEEDEIVLGRQAFEAYRDQPTVPIRGFFHDLELSPPFCDRLPGAPVWSLLPFYNHVIVWLEPFKSEADFEALYGLSAHQFAEHCGTPEEPGKIVPILNASPPAFAGLAHFERILSLRPPTMWRDFFFQQALAGADHVAIARSEAESLLPVFSQAPQRFASLRGTEGRSVRDLAVSSFVTICSFGAGEIARRVVSRARNEDEMLDLLFYYSLVLYDSLVSPLGGVYPCSSSQFNKLLESVVEPAGKGRELLPLEVGCTLTSGLEIPAPASVDGQSKWMKELSTIWEPAREALGRLDDALEPLAAHARLERSTQALSEAFGEAARETNRSIPRRGDRLRWSPIEIGLMGRIDGAGLASMGGLVSSMSRAALELNLFDMDSVYSRIERPRHLVAVLDWNPT